MKAHSWMVLAAGFGASILLIAMLGFGAMHRAGNLYSATVSTHEAYLRTDAALREIPAELYLGSIMLRDYLLDPSGENARSCRRELTLRQASIEQKLDLLGGVLSSSDLPKLHQMRTELSAYWQSSDPIFTWTPAERAERARTFLREQVIPRRDSIVKLAREIETINANNLRAEQERLSQVHDQFQHFLRNMAILALATGLIIALLASARVATLERRSEHQRGRAERAEQDLRNLSRKLVRTQEEERRSLSRELHDAIGQMLAAMTMELGNIESLIGAPAEKQRERLNEARRLNTETIHGVRDLATALRPAMLDELGLGPALRSNAREFTRRSGVPVTVQIDGNIEDLPDTHRTAIYRIVQEALSNCAKHAQAGSIRISLYGRADCLRLSVQDDGVGFDPEHPSSRGLGLVGIEERVRELEGSVKVVSQPGKGTILDVEVPIGSGVAAI